MGELVDGSGEIAEGVADQQLLERVVAGDQGAFAELYARCAPLVLGILVRLLGDRRKAEEVLQETFLQAWSQAGSFRADLAKPRGWLMMLGRSRALDRLRSNRSRTTREHLQANEVPSTVHCALSHLLTEEARSQVRTALVALPAEQRQALVLAFFAGLSHTEVATRLCQPLGTVKSRILFGMRKIRGKLASDELANPHGGAREEGTFYPGRSAALG